MPVGIELSEVVSQARYIGSQYHKDVPSFVGRVPHPRPNANICPRHLGNQQAVIQEWLRQALLNGQFSGTDMRGIFPHKVWHREGDMLYEAVGDSSGMYHGYPLEPEDAVRGM